MTDRRRTLLAILLYVTLDLSVPAVPGAFVFESTDSVEISGVRVGESKAATAVLPALARQSGIVSQPSVACQDRWAAISAAALPCHAAMNRLPRATLEPTPPSEDAH